MTVSLKEWMFFGGERRLSKSDSIGENVLFRADNGFRGYAWHRETVLASGWTRVHFSCVFVTFEFFAAFYAVV